MTLSSKDSDLALLIGRLFIAVLFIPIGLSKITNFEGTLAYINAAHVPFGPVDAVIGMVVELGFVTMLLIGYKARWAALGIIIYVVVISFLFHHYWDMPAAQVVAQKLNFFKNTAIIGGLFAYFAVGAGGYSLDARHERGWRGAVSA
jgi:putative oxidoreductase